MASIVFVYIQSITKIFEWKSDVCQHHVHGQKRIGCLFVGGNIFNGVCKNCLLSFLLLREEGEECHWWEWITKGNTRIKCAQMRANACLSTRFSTRVCAKIVRAFCVCVGRLSLTCTVIQHEISLSSKASLNQSELIQVVFISYKTYRSTAFPL